MITSLVLIISTWLWKQKSSSVIPRYLHKGFGYFLFEVMSAPEI